MDDRYDFGQVLMPSASTLLLAKPSVRTSPAVAATVAAQTRSISHGLGAAQLRAIGVDRAGTWQSFNKDCKYLGVRVYDKPATPANLGQYILVESSYMEAQAKLRLALTMRPKTGLERWHWMQAVMGWVSIAHWATSFPAQFLYTMQPVETPDRKRDVMAFGPKKARAIVKEMLHSVGPKNLFLPIPVREFFRFEDPHGLSPPWQPQERGVSLHDQKVLELRRGQGRRTTRRRKRDRPWIGISHKDWLNNAGGSLTRTPKALVTVLGMDVPRNASLDVRGFHGRLPSPQLMVDYVRAWAEAVVAEPFGVKTSNAMIHWLEYTKGFPAATSGMSAQQIHDAQIAMAKAKGQAISGGIFSTAATVLAATGVFAWVGAIVAAVGAAVSAMIQAFGGSLQGCPHTPRPPTLRSLKDADVSVDVRGNKNMADTIRAWETIAERVDTESIEEGPGDTLPAEDGDGNNDGVKKKSALPMVAGGTAVIGIILWLNRLRP
jgi:hypothetical protein